MGIYSSKDNDEAHARYLDYAREDMRDRHRAERFQEELDRTWHEVNLIDSGSNFYDLGKTLTSTLDSHLPETKKWLTDYSQEKNTPVVKMPQSAKANRGKQMDKAIKTITSQLQTTCEAVINSLGKNEILTTTMRDEMHGELIDLDVHDTKLALQKMQHARSRILELQTRDYIIGLSELDKSLRDMQLTIKMLGYAKQLMNLF